MLLALEIVCTIILIEAITNILTKSGIFRPLRAYLFSSDNRILKFVHVVMDCSYCTSVWVGLFCTGMFYFYKINILPYILALFFMGLVLHRLSNVLHSIIDRIDSNHLGLDKENE